MRDLKQNHIKKINTKIQNTKSYLKKNTIRTGCTINHTIKGVNSFHNKNRV